MIKESTSGSTQSKVSRTAEDPLIALFREHSRRVRAQVGACRQKEGESLSGTLAQWITLQFTVTAHRLALAAGEEGLSLEVLQKLTACIVALRKGDQAEEWIDLECRRVEIAEQMTTERMEASFDEWLDDPEVMERFRPKPKMSEEEKERRIKAVFGITDDKRFYPQQEEVAEEDEDEDEDEGDLEEEDENAVATGNPLEGDAPS